MATFQLELVRPWLLVGLLILPLLVYYFRRSLVDFPWSQRLVSLVCRSLIVVLLILALAGLTLLVPTTRQFVVLLADESLSIGDEARATTQKYMDEAREHASGHELALLRFAAEPGQLDTEVDAAP